MADDPNPALRTELNAALAVLAPQIRGLNDLATTSISTELLAEVNDQITARVRRQGLIQAVLNGLDAALAELEALDADGYPDLPAVPVLGSLFAELQEESSDLAAATGVFSDEQITAGPLTQTPNPTPPSKTGP
jgi:hypothetical protein